MAEAGHGHVVAAHNDATVSFPHQQGEFGMKDPSRPHRHQRVGPPREPWSRRWVCHALGKGTAVEQQYVVPALRFPTSSLSKSSSSSTRHSPEGVAKPREPDRIAGGSTLNRPQVLQYLY